MTKFSGQETKEYKIQDEQYQFPYHYIPSFKNGIGKTFRVNHNGYEYLCYTKHVEESIKLLSPKSILEVGCGDGKIIGNLNEIPERLGVDLSERAVSFAKAFNPHVEFQVMDVNKLNRSFDVVFAVEVLEHIPDDQLTYFFKAISDKVNNKGHVIITVPSKVKPLIEKHFRHYDLTLFKDQLEKANVNLVIQKVEYIYKESRLIKLYRRLTYNKFWLIEFNMFHNIVWRYVWGKLRFASEEKGLHLVVTLQKK